MDSITQIALGAAIGQAIGYKKLGNKALVMGALGGFLPDLDVMIPAALNFVGHSDEFAGWKYHRHFTHSLWFGPVLGSLMGYGLWRHYGRQIGHLVPWIWIMVLSILTHPLLDACTIYGTQLFAPFSNHRFYISSVGIIDPIYTVPLLIAIAFTRFERLKAKAQIAAVASLIFTTAFLGYAWKQNFIAEDIARAQLDQQHIAYNSVHAYTTIFQPFMRRIVVRQPDQVRIGFVSSFAPQEIKWSCMKQALTDVKDAILQTEGGRMMNWFSTEELNLFYDEQSKTYLATDIRYGVPGPSVYGWWGAEFRIDDHNGDLSAEYLGRWNAERDASFHAIGELFKASYGFPNTFLPKSDTGCS